ncbi:MAG: DUF488 domain-containing protein [Dissulfurispiraceae bacterium]|jgi:uncharacterized protein YeaO (DUF488 family)
MIKTKRVYELPSADDGKRVLVDRLWPRGLSKEAAAIKEWMKEIAPSEGLRKWFGHDPVRWQDFREKYKDELRSKPELIAKLKAESKEGTVTLLYAAKDNRHNNALVLKEMIG